MQYFIKQTAVLIITCFLLQPTIVIAQLCNDLIIIMDSQGDELVESPSERIGSGKKPITTLMQDLERVLYEKATPIIVTSNVLENFCLAKIDPSFKQMEDSLQEALDTNNPANVESVIQSITEKFLTKALQQASESDKKHTYPPDLIREYLLLHVLGKLTASDWHAYLHNNAKLVLLVPNNYIAQRMPAAAITVENQIKECGFKLDKLTKIQDLTPNKLLRTLQNRWLPWPLEIIPALESMFIQQKESLKKTTPSVITRLLTMLGNRQAITQPSQDLPNNATWNIVLTGHGKPGRNKKDLQATIASLEESNNYFQESITNLKKNPTLENSKQSINNYHSYIKDNTKFIVSSRKQLSAAENLSDDATLPKSAFVAGLVLEDFVQLMSFFEKSIQTSFVHYGTCFSGGHNRALVNESLEKLNVGYLVSTEGVNELSIFVKYQRSSLEFNEAQNKLIMTPLHFKPFFTMLRDFFCNPEKFTEDIKAQGLPQQEPLAAIIKNVTAEKTEDNNMAFIRIPRIGTFEALKTDKKIKILTRALAKAHELEHRPIDLRTANPEAVLIYPTRVNVPINLSASTALIAPNPQSAELSTKKRVHIFNKINFDGNLASFISNLIQFNSNYSTITFLVKELECQDYVGSGLPNKPNAPITLKNMILNITSANYLFIKIAFEFKGIGYNCSYRVAENFEPKEREALAKNCRELRFYKIYRTPVDLVKTCLGPIASDATTEIDLPALYAKIDASVPKELTTEQLGTLKTMILKKIASQKDAASNTEPATTLN